MKVDAVGTTAPAKVADAEGHAKDTRVIQVAHEFEGMLVRQLLQSAHMGGEKQDAYGGMAVDALASGVEKGGGLGLARAIEEALTRASSK